MVGIFFCGRKKKQHALYLSNFDLMFSNECFLFFFVAAKMISIITPKIGAERGHAIQITTVFNEDDQDSLPPPVKKRFIKDDVKVVALPDSKSVPTDKRLPSKPTVLKSNCIKSVENQVLKLVAELRQPRRKSLRNLVCKRLNVDTLPNKTIYTDDLETRLQCARLILTLPLDDNWTQGEWENFKTCLTFLSLKQATYVTSLIRNKN